MTIGNRLFIVLVTLSACVSWDQATKLLAKRLLAGRMPLSFCSNLLRFEYAENIGAFLGLGDQLPDSLRWVLLIALASFMLVGLTLFVYLKHDLSAVETLGYGLILAGGTSNVFNRIVSGYVIDFLNVGIGGVRTGIFNVADVSILIGFVIVTWQRWGSVQLSTVENRNDGKRSKSWTP
jgi:signal peptidase II